MLKSQILSRPLDVLEAKRLVYKVYANSLGWLPEPGNPSGFRVAQDKNGAFFEDNFGNRSIWVGIYSHDELVATARILTNFQEESHEVEHYTSLPKMLTVAKAKAVEINRVAILPNFQSPDIFAFLIQSLVTTIEEMPVDFIFTTVAFPEPGNFCKKLGFVRDDRPIGEFKYSAKDKTSVSIVYFEMTNKAKIERLLNICEDIITQASKRASA